MSVTFLLKSIILLILEFRQEVKTLQWCFLSHCDIHPDNRSAAQSSVTVNDRQTTRSIKTLWSCFLSGGFIRAAASLLTPVLSSGTPAVWPGWMLCRLSGCGQRTCSLPGGRDIRILEDPDDPHFHSSQGRHFTDEPLQTEELISENSCVISGWG